MYSGAHSNTVEGTAAVVDSQAKGKAAERAVCSYLTQQGLAARRHVRTGDKDRPDEGDIRLDTAPVTIEVKSWGTANPVTVGAARTLIEKLGRQKRPGDLGWLVVKANGHANPAVWWCWSSTQSAFQLLAGRNALQAAAEAPEFQWAHGIAGEAGQWPVRMRLDTAVALLHAGGWVRSLVNPFARSSEVRSSSP
jgi:hypothetical protein